jgi:hypothetical protein
MNKNTGMNAKDEKEGKTAHLTTSQAKAVNKSLESEKNDPAPTKTVESVNKARDKKKNETNGNLLTHKPI